MYIAWCRECGDKKEVVGFMYPEDIPEFCDEECCWYPALSNVCKECFVILDEKFYGPRET